MTEAESLELAATFTANASTNFTIFISFTFAFLATAYFVGKNLSRFQFFAASGMYAIAAGSAAISCVGWLQAFDAIMESKPTFLNSLPIFSGGVWVGGMSVLFVAGLLVSLYFMWDVRQARPE
jgi:hypothetical protein